MIGYLNSKNLNKFLKCNDEIVEMEDGSFLFRVHCQDVHGNDFWLFKLPLNQIIASYDKNKLLIDGEEYGVQTASKTA